MTLAEKLLSDWRAAQQCERECRHAYVRHLQTAAGMPGQDNSRFGALIQVAADFYQISVDAVVGQARLSQIIPARQGAMYLCRNLLPGTSLQQIGDHFGRRHHGTVMYAVLAVRERMSVDPEYTQQVSELLRLGAAALKALETQVPTA